MSTSYDQANEGTQRRTLRALPVSERPLTRLRTVGPTAMSNVELLSIVLGTPDAIETAVDVIRLTGGLHHLSRFSAMELSRVGGVGMSLAGRLQAVAEVARRIASAPPDDRPQVSSPADSAVLLSPLMAGLPQEHLRVILLDTRNRVIDTPLIYIGSLNTAVIRAAEVIRPAIVNHAASLIVAHNHPSGDPSPSPEDVAVTRQLVDAGKTMDVSVLDHIIIGGYGRYVSLRERGLM